MAGLRNKMAEFYGKAKNGRFNWSVESFERMLFRL